MLASWVFHNNLCNIQKLLQTWEHICLFAFCIWTQSPPFRPPRPLPHTSFPWKNMHRIDAARLPKRLHVWYIYLHGWLKFMARSLHVWHGICTSIYRKNQVQEIYIGQCREIYHSHGSCGYRICQLVNLFHSTMEHVWLAIQPLRIALEVVQLTLDVGILDLARAGLANRKHILSQGHLQEL